MYDNSLNCWFYDENVTPDDMKLISKTFAQFCWAANGGYPLAVGITPTISGGNINVTKGFVYFGETSDTNYIERTGVNQLYAFVNASVVSLAAQTCYLYIKPVITYDANIRVATVTGELYTSTKAADEGIQIATIVSGGITAINSINPLGATALQRGTIMLSLLDAYGKLSADNNWTGLNSFSQIPKVIGINTQGAGIVASGSNEYGYWEKYSNGKIRQWGAYNYNDQSSGFISKFFPVSFTDVSSLTFVGIVSNSTAVSYVVEYNSIAIGSVGLAVIRSDTSAFANATISWIVEGY